MFNLFGTRNGSNCDGSSRRDFLKIGALGMGALTLPDLLRASGCCGASRQANQKHFRGLALAQRRTNPR